MNELNAKVAKAMGWTYARSHLLGCYGWSDVSCAWRGREPLFDTDPALLPEMLAWLTSRGFYVEMSAGPGVECTAGVEGIPVSQTGKSLNEAVARLVVAVADEKP